MLVTPNSTAVMLLKYRDIVIRAARAVDEAIIDLEESGTWAKVRVDGIPLDEYFDWDDMDKLKVDIQAENDAQINAQIWWLLGKRRISDRWQSGSITASSVIITIKDRATAEKVAKNGIRLGGRLRATAYFIEKRDEILCTKCGKKGHTTNSCEAQPNDIRCVLCAGNHIVREHKCNVIGCNAKVGQACAHTIIKCCNCGAAHAANSTACKGSHTVITNDKKPERNDKEALPNAQSDHLISSTAQEVTTIPAESTEDENTPQDR